ncbi:MAG: OmpA family protein [Woeseia sp.]
MKKSLFGLTSFVLAVLLSTTAQAQPDNWYVAPAVVYTDDDGDRNIDDSLAGAQLSVGRAVSERISLEGLLGYSDINGFPGQKHFEASFNALGILNPDSAISTYLLAGVGYLGTELENAGDENRPTGSLGIGFTWAYGDGSILLRAEYRARLAYESNNNLTDRIATLGWQFSFGRSARTFLDSDRDGVADDGDRCPATAIGVEVDDTGCERDSDGDGVVDSADPCPNTPAGAPVDSFGCPRDSDGDHIPDYNDRCPDTVNGVAVDADGCERDDDGDNVVNRLDRCPKTTADVRVDVNGCEIRDVIDLPGVNFASNSDRLLPGAEHVLANAVATLRMHPELVVEVAGHTDSNGNAAYNQGLSERRANTVRDYMINAGANPANLSARGYGEAEPIADNVSAQGRAANRRVELRIRH